MDSIKKITEGLARLGQSRGGAGNGGADPERVPTVVVSVRLDGIERLGNDFYKFGRRLAGRWKRDAEVILGEGVSVLRGGFAESGGSRQYPKLDPEQGTVLIVREVPISVAEAAVRENPEAYQLAGDLETTRVLLEDEKRRLEERLENVVKELEKIYKKEEDSTNKT